MGRAEDLFKRIREGGESEIDNLIRDRQSEELFLDFKRSADNGSGGKLHDNDRGNLARAISGFGNSEGGVVVWGVDCRDLPGAGDVASAKVPIENPQRFKSWLEGAVSGCTVPPHSLVQHAAIESAAAGRGFVVTLIPKSSYAPHQTVKPLQYFIRAGSDFVPAPHGVLAGLFGRSPQPFVFHMWKKAPAGIVRRSASVESVEFLIGFMFTNDGPGVVRDLYVTAKLFPPRGGTQASFKVFDRQNWTGTFDVGVVLSLVSKDSYKLAPKAWAVPFGMQFSVAPPFETNLEYEITFGCQGSPARLVRTTVDRATINAAYDSFLRDRGAGDSAHQVVTDMLGLKAPDITGPEYYDSAE